MATLLYGAAGSPCVRAARLALEEKGVAYEFVPVDPRTLRDPENLARHPFGRMPSFAHHEFTLFETQAIMRYVDQAFTGPALQPAEPRCAARMNQIMGIVDWYVFPSASAGIAFERLIAPRLLGRPADEGRVATAVPQAATCVRVIEGLMGDGPYLAGPSLSLADLIAVPHLAYLAETPEGRGILGPHGRLRSWLAMMAARGSMARAMAQAA